jgi:hypothetical protein
LEDLKISNNIGISFSFPSLTHVSWDVEITDNYELTEIDFPALMYIGDDAGGIAISDNYNLTKILFPNLLYAVENIEITNGTNYTEINFEKLIGIGKNLDLKDLRTDNPANMAVKFDSLQLVFNFAFEYVEAEVLNFPELRLIVNSMKFYDNEFVSVLGLPKLQAISWDMNLAQTLSTSYLPSVGTNLTVLEFPSLEYIGESIYIYEDQFPALVNLSFPELERVDGSRATFNLTLSPNLQSVDFPKFKGFRSKYYGFYLSAGFISPTILADDNIWPVIECRGDSTSAPPSYYFSGVSDAALLRIGNATKCEPQFYDHFYVNYLQTFFEESIGSAYPIGVINELLYNFRDL